MISCKIFVKQAACRYLRNLIKAAYHIAVSIMGRMAYVVILADGVSAVHRIMPRRSLHGNIE